MKICMIIPPSPFLLDERVFMSLGILKVAAMLEREGHSIDMLDLSGVENYCEVVSDYVRTKNVSHYCLTATTPQMPAATNICEVIKKIHQSARIILGGPHGTLVHAAYRLEQKEKRPGRATKALEKILAMTDVLVAGDGELAVLYALEDSAGKIIDADDPKSDLFLKSQQLTDLPFPARHLVDVSSYHYTIDGVRALSLIAQLGCPFGCGFCGGRMSPFLRRVRMRTSEHIVQEILHLHTTYGVSGFMLYDDELNVNPKIVELMRLIAKTQLDLGVEFRLRGFVKAELFTDEQAEAMYAAGFRWLLVGFESGSDLILENINKKASRADNTKAMKIAKRHNLKVKALMSVGHPGESEGTIRATRDWLLEVRPDDFDATVITTYPGTPYFDEAQETEPHVWTYTYQKTGGRLHSKEVDYAESAQYYKGVPGEYISFVYTDHLTSESLVRLRDWLEEDVRKKLGIPYNAGYPALRYEHSMGQGTFPVNILRSSQ